MSFEIQETFFIKLADVETLEFFYNRFYLSVYNKVLGFLRASNLFDFENTQIYNGEFGDIYNYEKDFDEFRENHNSDDEDYYFKKLKFEIDYNFTAIEQENLLQDLNVEGYVEIFDSFENVLDKYDLNSINKVRTIGTPLYGLLAKLKLKPTPYLENLTYKYFLKIDP